ncbi:MAG: hypothetical protein HC795_19055 [Coleofasciculaceae cyanobacterium RL_1_1]|nr:hypothetical protein [Coleofasciculaceae cyanobacterium RL_1_1]
MLVSLCLKRFAPATIKFLSIAAILGAPSLMLLVVPPALTQQAAPQQSKKSIWQVFNSDAGGFSLLMPGEPIESESDGVKSYSVTRAKESVTYTVSFIDFPTNPTQETNGITEAFTGIKDGIVEEGGKIRDEKTVAIKGFPGKELRVSMPDGALTRVRSYIVGKRLYLVMASTNNEQNLQKSLQGFLDSFRVKPNLIPEAIPTKSPLPATVRPQPAPEATPQPDSSPQPETTPETTPTESPAASET